MQVFGWVVLGMVVVVVMFLLGIGVGRVTMRNEALGVVADEAVMAGPKSAETRGLMAARITMKLLGGDPAGEGSFYTD